jgi:hypothetical protein
VPDRIPVVKVWLNRAEGPTYETGPRTVKSLSEASDVIHGWAKSAPPHGQGYDKTDFRVEWADGETYEGRLDMDQNHRVIRNPLGEQMQDHLLFLSGLRRPSRFDREEYERYLESIKYGEDSENRAAALRMLLTHEM